MTGAEERALLRDYLETCERLRIAAAQINNAWNACGTLLAAWAGIRRFVEEEGLLS